MFNVVQGTGETVGAALVAHPQVDVISFTGSVDTGRAIQAVGGGPRQAGLPGARRQEPLDHLPRRRPRCRSAAVMMGVWGASGQVCTCNTRVLVHESVHDELLERVVDGSRGLRIGGGFDPDVEMGPVVSAAQLERIQRYVQIGRDEGAELVLGGERHGDRGYFHQPTIFTSVRNDMRIAQEEIFGPVMSILKFSSEEEAYRIANDVEYGLAAGVWTNDLNVAHRASRALRVGTVWVNTYQMVYPSVSYGGVKQSGHGRNLGEASLDDFTQLKSVWTKVG